jgi:hypothetical protein
VKVGDNNYDFSGKVDITKKNVHIDVKSNFIKLLFTGNRNQEGLQGKLTLTINNSSDFVNDLAKIINLSFLAYVSLVKISRYRLTSTSMKMNLQQLI